MSLFERMLEEQLKQEEQRLMQQGLPVPHLAASEVPPDDIQGNNKERPVKEKKSLVKFIKDKIKPRAAKASTDANKDDDKMNISDENLPPVDTSAPPSDDKSKEPERIPADEKLISAPGNQMQLSSSVVKSESEPEDTDASDLPPPVDSMALFERMLEEQLRQEKKAKDDTMDSSDKGNTKTLEERFRSSQWKVRMEAYEELSRLFEAKSDDPIDPVYGEYASFMPTIIGEKNANALDKGLESVLYFVNNYKQSASKCADELIPLLIEKPLTSAKQTTQRNAKESILTLLEQCEDKAHVQRCVMELIITNQLHPPKQRNKIARVRAAVVNLLVDCISGFGVETIGVSNIIKCLPALFGETDRKVRAETTSLLMELFRWLRAGIMPYLDSMREVQKKELEAEFEKVKGDPAPVPTRFLRTLRPKHAISTADKIATRTAIPLSNASSSSAPSHGSAASNHPSSDDQAIPTLPTPVELDIFEITEPSPVISKLTDTFHQGIHSSKWSERRDALDELNKLTSKPRLAVENYGDIINKIVAIIEKEANVPVTKAAIEVVEKLCNGLRVDFSSYARPLLPHMIQRFKMKQQVICESVHSALHAMTLAKGAPVLFTELIASPILEDAVIPCLNSKVPSQRAHMLQFLQRGLEFTTRKPNCLLNGMAKRRSTPAYKRSIKTLAERIVPMCDDPNSQVRDLCFQILATMTMGKQHGCDCAKEVQPLLQNFDKVKLEKIQEIRTQTVQSLDGGTSEIVSDSMVVDGSNVPMAADNPVTNVRSRSRPKTSTSGSLASQRKSTSAAKRHRSVLSRNEADTTTHPLEQASGKPKNPSTIDSVEGTSANMSAETSMSIFAEMFSSVADGAFVTHMGSTKWNERLEAMEQLTQYVQTNKNTLFCREQSGKLPNEVTEVLVRVLSKVTKQWKETNVQVLGKIFSLIGWLGFVKLNENSEDERIVVTINSGIASLVIGGLVEKMATAKVKEVAKECLTKLSEVVTPQFVSSAMWSSLEKQRNPKIIAECITWLEEAMIEFHIRQWKIELLIAFVKRCLEHTNPSVKKATTSLICVMHTYTGESILNYLKDTKSTLLSQIKKEIEKTGNKQPAEPSRIVYSAKMLQQLSKGDPVVDKIDDDGDDIMPRTDISQHITPKLLKMLGEDKWKTRMEALDIIEKIIVKEGNKRIAPNIDELMKALRQRLDKDNTVMVVTTVANMIKLIAEALGPKSGNVDKYSKFVMPLLIGKQMFDQKRQVRQVAIEAVETWCRIVSISPMLKFCARALMTNDSKKGNPDGRKELLQFMADRIREEQHNSNNKDLLTSSVDIIVKPLVHTLMDPKSESRKLSETILSNIVMLVGEEEVKKHLRDLKPAIRETVSSILEKCFVAARNTITISAPAGKVTQSHPVTMASDQMMDIEDSIETVQPPAKRPRKGSLHSRPQTSGTLSGRLTSQQQKQQQQQQVQALPALLENELKEQRTRRERKNRWYFNEREQPLRPEQIEILKENMQHCVPNELIFLLFGDNQRQEQGMQILIEFLSDTERCLPSLVVQNFDVLLQYCSLKIYDQSNTKLQVKSLDLLLKLTSIAQEQRYRLSDYECSIFLPIFLDRLGHNIVIIRETLKKIVRIFSQIYHPKKMINYLLEAIKQARNPKTRYDCLNEIAELFEQYGVTNLFSTTSLTAAQQSDAHVLQNHSASSVYITISRYTNDVDNNVKTIALRILQVACRESQATAEQVQHIIMSCPDNALPQTLKQTILDRLRKVKSLDSDSSMRLHRQQRQRFLQHTTDDVDDVFMQDDAKTQEQDVQKKEAMPSRNPRSDEFRRNLEDTDLAAPMQSRSELSSITEAVYTQSSSSTSTSNGASSNGQSTAPIETIPISSGSRSVTTFSSTTSENIAPDRPRVTSTTQPSSFTGTTFATVRAMQPNSISAHLSDVNNFRRNEDLAVNAMKRLVEIFKHENRRVVPHLRDLITCLSENIQITLREADDPTELGTDRETSTSTNINRICKYLLNTMMQLFNHRTIVEFVPKDTLQYLIDQLLMQLLDEKLPRLEDGMLLKALNTLMLRILENSNRTHTYTSLLSLLAESCAVDYEQLSNESSRQTHKKYMELVVKCLLKLTKALSATIDRIDIDILLMDLHEFLTNNPPTQFKKRDDMPLRTIKTILNELVKVKGCPIRTHLSLIPTHRNPLIVSYIELMLSNGKQQSQSTVAPSVSAAAASHMNQSDPVDDRTAQQNDIRPSENTPVPDSVEDSQVLREHGARTALRRELTGIFACISTKDTTQQGLFQLYRFQKRNPNISLQPFLQKCSEPFQAYIKRQLSKIEQHEKMKAEAAASVVTASKTAEDSFATPVHNRRSANSPFKTVGVKSSIRSASAPRLRSSLSGLSGSIPRRSYTIDDASPLPLTSIREPGDASMSSVDAIRARLRLRNIEENGESTPSPTSAADTLRQRLADVEKMAVNSGFVLGSASRPMQPTLDLDSIKRTLRQHSTSSDVGYQPEKLHNELDKENIDLGMMTTSRNKELTSTTSQALSSLRERLARIKTSEMDIDQH